ncbi:hypothetical protein [Ligilactobacillus acidipiscis]|uniref:hypothetical protein n=1 Tax=Ligilactobacillus acidipiscis TaxID=89059 RepID=UPI0023F8E040|nr:hypothetical protein [Ligilactobacillus acidipiscis]WEV56149.1 hypothetical protein OZX66_07785 [Ligilactobacillus acidipiscis]
MTPYQKSVSNWLVVEALNKHTSVIEACSQLDKHMNDTLRQLNAKQQNEALWKALDDMRTICWITEEDK